MKSNLTTPVICLLLAALAAGCQTNWRTLDPRSIDQKRMVFPSNPPSEGPFVAMRRDGTVIDQLDDQPGGHTDDGVPQVKAAPIVPGVAPGGDETVSPEPSAGGLIVLPTSQPE